MLKAELQIVLELHVKWLNDEEGGSRANLSGADLSRANLSGADLSRANLRSANLSGADLSGANLSGADLSGADLRSANLSGADLSGANLRSANLSGADLSGANLRSANLSGADLDFSCLPLWCGSLGIKVDLRIVAQIAYHFCRMQCDDPSAVAAQNSLVDLANQFHRVGECGRLEAREIPGQAEDEETEDVQTEPEQGGQA